MAQNGICRMAAWDADGHSKILFGDRTVPNFVAALALPYHFASCLAQEFTQWAVELRGHSGSGRFGFAKRSDLQVERFRIGFRMIVRQKIQRNRRHFVQQTVECRRVGGSRDFIAMPGPDRSLTVPTGRNCENRWL